MCGITALGDFQGLWEAWETDSFIFIARSSHAFHQTVISTASDCTGSGKVKVARNLRSS
jgi:hypothetical protein